jgi:hypothetical protein
MGEDCSSFVLVGENTRVNDRLASRITKHQKPKSQFEFQVFSMAYCAHCKCYNPKMTADVEVTGHWSHKIAKENDDG